MRQGERLTDVRRLAVLRANGLGDFIFILPALEALRATYPRAEIVLLARPWHQAFLSQRPTPVDRVVVVPPYGGVSAEPGVRTDQGEVTRFFQTMRQEGFDLACQFHGGGHFSNPFVTELGARVSLGLRGTDAPPLDRWIPYRYFQTEYYRYLEVAELAGARAESAEPHLAVTGQDRAEAARVWPGSTHGLAILHPGARDPGRRWPPEKFALVGDALVRSGLRVALTGMNGEQETTARVAQAMREPCANLCGQLSLCGLAALLAASRVVVANDTGPLHLAHAVGARTVGLYWCFNLLTAAPLSRQRHAPLVSWQLHCPVCGCDRSHAHCEHSASFISAIPAEEVIAAAQGLLRP